MTASRNSSRPCRIISPLEIDPGTADNHTGRSPKATDSLSVYLSSDQYRDIIRSTPVERKRAYNDPPLPTDGATKARPGTEGKIAVFAARLDRDEQLFHPGDLTVEQCKLLDALAYGVAHNSRNGAENNDLSSLTILRGLTQ